jgi:hypothetical protein
LKTEFGATPPSQPLQAIPKLPPNASLHQIGLLRRARQSNSSLASDIDLYLGTPPIAWDLSDETNYTPDWALKWWNANAFQYPTMAKAARALLAVPGSEVDVERLFSGGRDMLGIRRYALKGETMRILTLLKAYFERQLKNGEVELPEVRTTL